MKTENSSEYFCNSACAYFPCHQGADPEHFNCLFCYCPLYPYPDCGGTYTCAKTGVKNCRDCGFPHERKNYAEVVRRLKERMHEKCELP